uniref:Uncharacterized protein n=1 Tax=Enterococcus faecalis TaxID=1351 RepID=A0A1W6QYG9_ENTFL|nr:hypothetical protein [Enterococcus faecalis]
MILPISTAVSLVLIRFMEEKYRERRRLLTDKQKALQESLDFLKRVNDEIQRVQLENEELRSQNRALRQANSHSVEFMMEEGLTNEK